MNNDPPWDVGSLAVPNETAKLTIYAVVETPGTKINTTKIDAPNLVDPTPEDNVATVR